VRYELDFTALVDYWPDFLHGAIVTLQLTAIATVLGMAIGTLCAIGSRSKRRWLSRAVGIYVEIVRNTPFLIQIFFLYFGLASAGIRLPVFTAAVIAMVFNVAAYCSEIIRAGMETVHPGQIEAAQSLGMSTPTIYWDVILRPAIERVYPALTGQFVLMMLSSSVASQISTEELTAVANNVQSFTFRSFETFVAIAPMYLALAALLKLGFWLFGLIAFPRRRRLGTAL
jgi:polar amino acid transport system permease protein